MHSGSNTMWYATIWIASARNFAILVAANRGGGAAEGLRRGGAPPAGLNFGEKSSGAQEQADHGGRCSQSPLFKENFWFVFRNFDPIVMHYEVATEFHLKIFLIIGKNAIRVSHSRVNTQRRHTSRKV